MLTTQLQIRNSFWAAHQQFKSNNEITDALANRVTL